MNPHNLMCHICFLMKWKLIKIIKIIQTSQKESNNICLNIQICSIMTEQTPSVSSRVHTGPQWPSLSQKHVCTVCRTGSSCYAALHDSALQLYICSNYTTTSPKKHTTQNRHKARHCSIQKSNSIERLLGCSM